MIFINQKEWEEAKNEKEIFAKYAGGIGINIAQFEIDLKSKEIAEKVNNDYKGGIKAGVNATPTFFLGGKKISPQSYEEFKNIINEQLNNNF
ncbi:MAG: DSBA oxidoreductase [Candidatus Wolfebacteria bacterium GW2011_GWC1_37_10]|uniref:DSBA oxidoreductase n=1 Tax=Candidatus Wolfebacteria bacterium GW2011_GWC1_37_10 TaxID=1619010 RepID=A0A0G0FQS4_9BACT|nr:MAG: DSBA oxidoreductase [Candidatus Wolfebacteria bacterium GW2011_GWC1_37_10]